MNPSGSSFTYIKTFREIYR